MEHIVQFAIGIDDGAIRQSVERNAQKTIISNIERDIRNKMFSHPYRENALPGDALSDYCKNILLDLFAQDRDEIIEKAAELLAERFSKTKAAKVAAAKISAAAAAEISEESKLENTEE